MKITQKWLQENDIYDDWLYWFLNQKETDSAKILQKLIEENKFKFGDWLLAKLYKHGLHERNLTDQNRRMGIK